MRTFQSLFIIALLTVCGCSKKSPTAPTPTTTTPVATTPTNTTPTTPTPTTPPCAFTVSATAVSVVATAATGTVSVTTTSACEWTATSESTFVTITSARTVTGSGTVTFAITENLTDTTRTGTIRVAGQAVSVTQAAGDALYGNWSGTIERGVGCLPIFPASVEWSGVVRRTSGGGTELVVSILPFVLNQTVPVQLTGNTFSFSTTIDTTYGFTGTLATDHRSVRGTFQGGGCSGTWSGSRR